MFLVGSGDTDGTRILAAMSGIDNDQRLHMQWHSKLRGTGLAARTADRRQQECCPDSMAKQEPTGVCRVDWHTGA
jgi:hypothetical protein